MIIFSTTGIQVRRHLYNCPSCCLGNFDQCKLNAHDTHNVDSQLTDIDEELIALDETDDLKHERFTRFDKDSYVAVYSPENALELFYIVKVEKKCIANDEVFDIYNHIIPKGEEYCSGKYLEKVIQKGDYVQYKKLKKTVYIHPNEVFAPSVPINNDEDLRLPMAVYLSLAEYM